MNIQFARISWMNLITEVIHCSQTYQETRSIFHGNAKREDWP